MVLYGLRAKDCDTNKKKNKKQSAQNSGGGSRMVDVRGPGGFRLSFPVPRLPAILGSARSLSADNTIYPPMLRLDAPITPQPLTITAGALAVSVAVTNAIIQAWSTRFAALFREYCIVGARLEIRQINATTLPQGVLLAYIDEDSSANPTFSSSANRARLDMALVSNPVDRVYMLNWKPLDYLDLDWTSVGTNTTPAFLKLYTDTANCGTAATTALQIMVTGTLALCFRGYV